MSESPGTPSDDQPASPARQRFRDKLALAAGAGEVDMPESLARKYPNAPTECCWQYLFASASTLDFD